MRSFSLDRSAQEGVLGRSRPFKGRNAPFVPSRFGRVTRVTLTNRFLMDANVRRMAMRPAYIRFCCRRRTRNNVGSPVMCRHGPGGNSPGDVFGLNVLRGRISKVSVAFRGNARPRSTVETSLLVHRFSMSKGPPSDHSALLCSVLCSRTSVFSNFSVG